MPGKELDWRGYAVKKDESFDFELIKFEPKKQTGYDVDIAIEACGVCSSDTHTMNGTWGKINILPLIPGHEAAGYVKAIGDKVTKFKVGDRVGVGAQVWSCGECAPCKSQSRNYCVKMVDTYNAEYPDGSGTAHGGYSGAIRVPEEWTFKLPDEIEFKHAGPLQCAGVTVYSPLKRNGCGPGKKVGIIGIGGLGHLAVQFAKAMGAEVTAFTHQDDKVEDVKKMGASEVVVTDKEGKFAEKYALTFDLLLSTVDTAEAITLGAFCSMLKVNKPLAIVGLPGKAVPDFTVGVMMPNGSYIGTSHIGDPAESVEMLQIAAKHNVRPWLEERPMKDAGLANQRVHDNKVRYRGVLIRDF